MKRITGMLLAFVMMFLAACTNVGPGYEAVVVNKAGTDRSVTSEDVRVGYITFNPFTQTVTKYPNSINRIAWEGAETVTFNAEGARLGVGVAFSVRVVPGESYRVVQKYRNVPFDTILDGYMRDIVRNALGVAASKRELLDLLTDQREAFVQEAQEIINQRLSPDGFEIQALSLTTDFDMPDRVREQLNGILEAQNYAEEQRQRVQATIAEAESKRQAAEGTADAARIEAQGKADAIATEGEALRQNPEILNLRSIEKWSGVLPNVVGGDTSGLDLLIQPPLTQPSN